MQPHAFCLSATMILHAPWTLDRYLYTLILWLRARANTQSERWGGVHEVYTCRP